MIYMQSEKLVIRDMVLEDAKVFYETYLSYGWHPDMNTYTDYYKEQTKGDRSVFVAVREGKVAGLCTLVMHPTEGSLGNQDIPEIQDLCVFFDHHKEGIGNCLLDVVEAEAAKVSDRIYLAVGVHSGYGQAQRIYVKRGYIPDGSGVWYQGKVLEQYAPCCNDDELLLFFVKEFTKK